MTDAPRGPLASPGYWLRRAAQQWRRELGIRLRPLELTPTRFDVLAAIGWLGLEGIQPTQQAVADFSGNDRMMTSKVIATLQSSGLIVRIPDSEDARTNRLSVTATGRELLTRATAIARAVDADQFAAVEHIARFRDELRDVVER